MIRNKIKHLAHRVGMQFRDPGVIIGARADGGIQLVVIGNVVTMQTMRARLKIRRSIRVANSQRIKIRDDVSRLRKREQPIKLQPIGASWNTRILPFHGKQTSNAQRPTSNAEIQSLSSRLGVRSWAFGVLITSFPAL